MNRLVGSLIIILSVILATSLSGGLLIYLDIPSVITVVGVTIGGIFAGYGNTGWHYLTISLSNQKLDDEQQAVQAIHFYQYLGNLVLIAASMAIIMAVVKLLSNIDDPKQIGPALAFALLSVFYAAGLLLLFILPAKHHLIRLNRVEIPESVKTMIDHENRLSKRMLVLVSVCTMISLGSLFFAFNYLVV